MAGLYVSQGTHPEIPIQAAELILHEVKTATRGRNYPFRKTQS